MWMRNVCYDRGVLQAIRVPVPVISVGNMTTGGTGKTPVVEYLVRQCLTQGRKVAVISRGYKRETKGTVVVSDGRQVLADMAQAGDEPFQVAQKFSQIVVIVDEQRARGAQFAVGQFHVDVIILDDGFQHRALKRDLDIVMIDGQQSLAPTQMLPAGRRREPLNGLRRADIVAFSRADNVTKQADELRPYGLKLFMNIRYRPVRLHHYLGSEIIELSALKETSCVAFCGIGNPHSFEQTLREIRIDVKHFASYADHHRFSISDIESIKHQANQLKVNVIITTEKDAVRLKGLSLGGQTNTLQLYYLEVEAEITEGAPVLEEKLNILLRAAA
jgi:tetraacyldisaccharide 4'-kinase